MPLLPPLGAASPLRSPPATPGLQLSIVRSYGKGLGLGVGSWGVVPSTLRTTILNQTTHSVTPPRTRRPGREDQGAYAHLKQERSPAGTTGKPPISA